MITLSSHNENQSFFLSFIFFILIALVVGALSGIHTVQAASCTTSQNLPADARSIFSRAIDVFNDNAALIKMTCKSTTAPQIMVGTTANDVQTYVWHKAYYTNNGNTFSKEVRLTGPADTTGNWIIGAGTATIPMDDARDDYVDHIAAYVCQNIDGAWKCGCSSRTQCAQPKKGAFQWFLLSFSGLGSTNTSQQN